MKDVLKKIFKRQVYSNEERIKFLKSYTKISKGALILGIIMLLVGYFSKNNPNMENLDSFSGALIGGSLGFLIISSFLIKRLNK